MFDLTPSSATASAATGAPLPPLNLQGRGGDAYGAGSAGGPGLLGDSIAQNPKSGIGNISIGGLNAPPVPNVPGQPTLGAAVIAAPAAHPFLAALLAGALLLLAQRKGWL